MYVLDGAVEEVGHEHPVDDLNSEASPVSVSLVPTISSCMYWTVL